MVTIKDLARTTNISKSTISRYLNNGYVSIEKRNIIKKAIKDLNYKGNSIAKSLKTNKSMTIALVVPSVTNFFFSNLAEIMQSKINSLDYRMILYTTQNDEKREMILIDQIVASRVDGIIVSTGSKLCRDKYESLDIPIVALDRAIGVNIPLIISNNALGAEELAQHLHSKGCTKILFIESADDSIIPSYYRKNGFLKYAEKHNLEASLMKDSEIDVELINKESIIKYDAIMVWNDQTAFRVSNVLYKLGVNIGTDVLLTGYDNSLFSRYMNPPLTTSHQPTDMIGEKVVEVLINIINGFDIKNQKIVFHNSIVKRESTGD